MKTTDNTATKCTWSERKQTWSIGNLTTAQYELLCQITNYVRESCVWDGDCNLWVTDGGNFTTFSQEEMDALSGITL